MPFYNHYPETRGLDMNPFAAFIEVCEEDAHHLPVCLAEVTRLGMPFGIHFDRCTDETKALVRSHPLLVAEHSNEDREYDETHKQGVFDKLSKHNRFKWLVHWNVDEIWEKDAPKKLLEIAQRDEHYLYCRWINTWGDMRHIRTDGPFNTPRVKFYNVSNNRWWFAHKIIHGAKMMDRGMVADEKKIKFAHVDLVCLHHGLMTRALREQHKERWDRIYNKATNGDGKIGRAHV